MKIKASIENLPGEKWEYVEGYEEKYQVSNIGRIKSKRTKTSSWEIRKLKFCEDGYFGIALCKNGKMKHLRVHRLVASAFIRTPKEGEQVNHIDGRKTNNEVSNLEWVTAQGNSLHAYRTGLNKPPIIGKGENCVNSKLTNENIYKIRELLELGETQEDIAKKFGVHSSNISRIKLGSIWSHLK